MKDQHHPIYPIVILFLAILACLIIFIFGQVLLGSDLVSNQTSSLDKTRTAIVSQNEMGVWGFGFATATQNPIVKTLIAQTQTATAQAPTGTFTPTPSS